MSIDVMSKVLQKSLLPEGERFALIVLADFGNSDGVGIYASRKTIAKRMGTSVMTVVRRLSNLKDCGVLTWDVKGHDHKNGNETNEYKINVEMIGKENVSKIKTRKQMEDERVAKAASRKGGSNHMGTANEGEGSTHVGTTGSTHMGTTVVPTWVHKPLDKPLEETLGTRFALQKRGDDGTGNESQGNTQPLEESSVDKKAAVPPPAAVPPAPARAPAPPARKPDPAQVQQADDLMERYADHKQGGKLANWPITRRAIDKAVKNGAQEDKAAINAACDELKEVVSGIANAFGWRHWFDRKSALLVISLDLPLDTIRAYVQADCDGMAKKQKDREGYGMGDALQACRLGMAAHVQEQKKPQGPIAMRAPDGRPVMIDRDEIDLALAKGYTHV